MRLLIASDIHGAASWCKRLMDAMDEIRPDRVVLLGDLLYHGPRNDLPDDYAPKDVVEMLNGIGERIIAVRGNCEAEVDQMVLSFPCMADYNVLWDPDATNPVTGGRGRELFLTHGHVYGPGIHSSIDRWPQLPAGSVLVYGHTCTSRARAIPTSPSSTLGAWASPRTGRTALASGRTVSCDTSRLGRRFRAGREHPAPAA